MSESDLDLGPIEGRLQLECTQNVGSWGLTTEYQSHVIEDMTALIAEVKRLRGDGLKEYNWNDIEGYGGGYDYTVVASSIEEAREFAKKRFAKDSFLEYVFKTEPDIYDFSPKGKGYYEYHMDAGG